MRSGRQRERPDAIGRGEGGLLGDRAAHRVAQQVERLDVQRVGQRERVLRHVADLVVAVRDRRLAHVAVVEDHRAVALGERVHLQRPRQRVRGEPHDADQGLPVAVLLVVEALAVGVGEGHGAAVSRADAHHDSPA